MNKNVSLYQIRQNQSAAVLSDTLKRRSKKWDCKWQRKGKIKTEWDRDGKADRKTELSTPLEEHDANLGHQKTHHQSCPWILGWCSAYTSGKRCACVKSLQGRKQKNDYVHKQIKRRTVSLRYSTTWWAWICLILWWVRQIIQTETVHLKEIKNIWLKWKNY